MYEEFLNNLEAFLQGKYSFKMWILKFEILRYFFKR